MILLTTRAAAAVACAGRWRGTASRASATSRRPPGPLPCLLLLAIATAPAAVFGQSTDLQLPITLDADSTDYDGKNSMLMFRGLRLSQGSIGVQADEGRASKLDFEDSVWQFKGNVIIDVENGHMESTAADLKFDNNELEFATITGAPATFELRRPGSDVVTHAEANNLKYDFRAGTVEFSDNAVILEGCNQISSNYLVYNIKEQRINAQSTGDGGQKVKITYTPRDAVNAKSCAGNTPTDTHADDEKDDDRE